MPILNQRGISSTHTMPSFSHKLRSSRRIYCPLLHMLRMPIRDIIVVNSSDDESDTEEREFEWEPTKNRSREMDGRVDPFDMPDALPSFRCPIDHCVMRDPVILSDGHSYDRPNIVRWLSTNLTSPMTGRILVDRKLSPNLNLLNAIREWLETRVEKEREDAARHEREAEEATRVEEEKAKQISMAHERQRMRPELQT